MGLVTTTAYDQANSQLQKEPIIVLNIAGLSYVFSSNQVYTKIRYDDPGVYYDGEYQYDGLRPLDPDSVHAYIDRKKSFSTISQKLEQWDGKASVETFNMSIIDKDGLLTEICTPGALIPDIINAKVTVYFGYKNLSYPEDYLILFKGYVNKYDLGQGFVNFMFTDPSSQRKQSVFNAVVLTLTAPVSTTDTVINLTSTASLYTAVPNAKGAYDPTVTMGLVLNNAEIVTYTNAGILNGTQLQVTRGQFGTTPTSCNTGDTTEMFINFQDNPISIALKTMLSGWGGAPWVSSLPLRGINNLDTGLIEANTITFPITVDLVRDYGLVAGDFVTLSGSPNAANNNVFTVLDIINSNRSILVAESGVLVQENAPTGGYLSTVAAFNSKYDTYPASAGLQLTPDDVFVSQHEYVKTTFIQNTFNLSIKGEESVAKTFIETDLFKPVGAYSLTQGAKISVGCTHPPLSTDLTKFIDPSNVVKPENIVVTRGVDTRFFYNEIIFNFQYNVIDGTFYNALIFEDAESQSRLNQVSTLSIDCKGFDGSSASITAMTARAKRLMQRYRFSAETVTLQTFFGVGHTIDAGDTVVLNDYSPSVLQIANTQTGTRGVYNRVMEVQERSISLTDGTTKLVLLSNNGFSLTDRYVVVGPSSNLDPSFSQSATRIRIIESFYTKTAEYEKWLPYDGSKIVVFNSSWTQSAETYFTIDPFDEYQMTLNPALPFTPDSSFHVQFSSYDDTDATINQLAKGQFGSFDSSAIIYSASSAAVFVLNSGYSSRYQAGMFVYVQSPDCTRYSPDVKILAIAGDVITIGPVQAGAAIDLGFVPQPGDIVQLAGFKDGGSGYRLI